VCECAESESIKRNGICQIIVAGTIDSVVGVEVQLLVRNLVAGCLPRELVPNP
jgi:hypothetical protein